MPTVQRWVDAGRLKAWKTLGGHRRVDGESADALFQNQDDGVLIVDQEPLTVVVVDDNPDDCDIITALVEANLPSASITVARNGYEGLLKIGKLQPDLVITDIVMPKMDGLELLAQLVLHTQSKPPVVLAVSSLDREQVNKRGVLPDEVTLIQKPLEPARFAEALAAMKRLGKRALRPDAKVE